MQVFKQDIDKFKELILYICEKSATDPNFGTTKLNKILFSRNGSKASRKSACGRSVSI